LQWRRWQGTHMVARYPNGISGVTKLITITLLIIYVIINSFLFSLELITVFWCVNIINGQVSVNWWKCTENVGEKKMQREMTYWKTKPIRTNRIKKKLINEVMFMFLVVLFETFFHSLTSKLNCSIISEWII